MSSLPSQFFIKVAFLHLLFCHKMFLPPNLIFGASYFLLSSYSISCLHCGSFLYGPLPVAFFPTLMSVKSATFIMALTLAFVGSMAAWVIACVSVCVSTVSILHSYISYCFKNTLPVLFSSLLHQLCPIETCLLFLT